MIHKSAFVTLLVAACGTPAAAPVAPIGAHHAANRPTPPACDTGSDDAQRAVYTRVTGLPWVGPEDFYGQTCLEGSTTFPGLLTTGSFATEVGCQWSYNRELAGNVGSDSPLAWVGAIYDCAYVHDAASIAETAMTRAGWAKGTPAARAALARAWVAEVIHARPLESDPGGFQPGKAFAAPSAEPTADGGVVVTYWIANETMGRGTSFSRVRVAFSPAGVPSAPQHLDDSYVEP